MEETWSYYDFKEQVKDAIAWRIAKSIKQKGFPVRIEVIREDCVFNDSVRGEIHADKVRCRVKYVPYLGWLYPQLKLENWLLGIPTF